MQRTVRVRTLFAAAIVAGAAAVAGCGGTTVTVPTNPSATPTPGPTNTPAPTSTSGSLSTNGAASTSLTLGPIGPNGNTGTVVAGASSTGSTFNVVFSLTAPANVPTLSSVRRLPRNIGGANLTPIGFFQITSNPSTTLPSWPGFSFTFGASQTLPDPTHSYVAVFDPTNPSAGWSTIEGPATASGALFTWSAPPGQVALNAGTTYTFVLFSTTSTLSTPSPTPSPTPTPTPSPTPTPTPAPGNLDVNTTTLNFSATGAANAEQLTVSETNYSGPFTVTTGPTSSCSGIVTVSPSTGTGPSQVFTVTPAAAGNCTLVVNDNGNNAPQSIAVTVTTTTGTISTVHRRP